MKIASLIAGLLLGFIFVALPGALLLGLMHAPAPDMTKPSGQFFAVFYTTGWLKFVQLCQILGGVLVAIPKTRNFGLLVLGPIIINILAYHILVANGEGLMGPPLVVAVLAAFLLFAERNKFAALAKLRIADFVPAYAGTTRIGPMPATAKASEGSRRRLDAGASNASGTPLRRQPLS